MINAKRAQQRLADRGFAIKPDGNFGGGSFAALMTFVGGRATVSPLRTDLGKAAARYFPGVGLTSPLRIAHALAQQSVETGGFNTLVENFDYTVAGLRKTFGPNRIGDDEVSILGRGPGEASLSAERQETIANIVYGGAFGLANLGNTTDGDGWKYRGRGVKQTTGRANYADVKAVTGLDVLAKPQLLEDPDMGVRAGCIFWDRKGCNAVADQDDIRALTLKINGGTNGLADRTAALARAKAILL
jgi:putative chitinase